MSRNLRALIAFALGALFVLAALSLRISPSRVSDALSTILNRAPIGGWFAVIERVSDVFLSGGMLIEGLALHAWVTAPRD